MPRPEKVQSVQEIAARFNAAEAALLTEYRGLHVSDIAEVRNALHEADTDYKVLKNTLTRIAVREVGLDELVGMLEGPTAIAFIHGDAVAAAKALDEAARKYPVLVVKGGVLQGKVIDSDQAKRLATIESREIQLGKIAMLVNTPLQQMVNVLAAPLRDLGSMLAQVVAKKESGELPAPGAPEATGAEEAEQPTAASDTEAGATSGPEAQPEQAGDTETAPAPESEAQAEDQAQPEAAPAAEVHPPPEPAAEAGPAPDQTEAKADAGTEAQAGLTPADDSTPETDTQGSEGSEEE
jgi:large subunit ribosomal protein L10